MSGKWVAWSWAKCPLEHPLQSEYAEAIDILMDTLWISRGNVTVSCDYILHHYLAQMAIPKIPF
jgi:hypothetical protein